MERAARQFRALSRAREGAEGYTPAMVSLAVSLTLQIATDPAQFGGQCWQFDCLYPDIRRIRTVAVPGCRRCSPIVGTANGQVGGAVLGSLLFGAGGKDPSR